MEPARSEEVVRAAHSHRLLASALQFTLEAIDFLLRYRPSCRRKKHATCEDLVYGARLFAFARYGREAHLVMKVIGIQTSFDLGDCVFALIKVGILSKTSRDRRRNFNNLAVYDGASFKPLYDQLPSTECAIVLWRPPFFQTCCRPTGDA